MKYVWKCRDCKTEYPEDKDDLPKYINPSGIEGVICPCGGMLDLCPTMGAGDLASPVAEGRCVHGFIFCSYCDLSWTPSA